MITTVILLELKAEVDIPARRYGKSSWALLGLCRVNKWNRGFILSGESGKYFLPRTFRLSKGFSSLKQPICLKHLSFFTNHQPVMMNIMLENLQNISLLIFFYICLKHLVFWDSCLKLLSKETLSNSTKRLQN